MRSTCPLHLKSSHLGRTLRHGCHLSSLDCCSSHLVSSSWRPPVLTQPNNRRFLCDQRQLSDKRRVSGIPAEIRSSFWFWQVCAWSSRFSVVLISECALFLPGRSIKYNQGEIEIQWHLNASVPANTSTYHLAVVQLCFGAASSKGRSWRAPNDDLSKSKNCPTTVASKLHAGLHTCCLLLNHKQHSR